MASRDYNVQLPLNTPVFFLNNTSTCSPIFQKSRKKKQNKLQQQQ